MDKPSTPSRSTILNADCRITDLLTLAVAVGGGRRGQISPGGAAPGASAVSSSRRDFLRHIPDETHRMLTP